MTGGGGGVAHFNIKGQVFCEGTLSGPKPRRGKSTLNNLNLFDLFFCSGRGIRGFSQPGVSEHDHMEAQFGGCLHI